MKKLLIRFCFKGMLLSIMMMLSLMPTTVFATSYTTSSIVALKDLSVGDIINGGITLTNTSIKNGSEVHTTFCEIYWLDNKMQNAAPAFAERTVINFSVENPQQTIQVPEKYNHIESWTIDELGSYDGIINRKIVVYPTNHSMHNFLISAKSADVIMATCNLAGCPLENNPTFTLTAEDAVVSSAETYTATLTNWNDFQKYVVDNKPNIQYNMVISGVLGSETTGNYIINHAGAYCATVTFRGVTIRKYFRIRIPVEECSHENTEVKDKIVATCTEEGYTGDTYCEDCGTKLSTGTTIAATGNHDFSKHVSNADGTHKVMCGICDATQDGHANDACTFDAGVVTKEPTTSAEGIKTFTCTACGGTKTETIPIRGTVDPTPTEVESINADNAQKVVKTIENGKVVIIRGDKKYDISGRELSGK